MRSRHCSICGTADKDDLCEQCWKKALYAAALRQDEALAAGRRAAEEGRRVIYIHGRPYADPAEAEHHEGPAESPFPWDLWDGERPTE